MIVNHLKELYYRLFYCLLGWIFRFIVSYEFISELLSLLSSGCENKFQLTGPFEIVNIYFALSFWVGLFVLVPLIYFQTAIFLLPGIYKHEVPSFVFIFASLGLLWLSSLTFMSVFFPSILNFMLYFVPTDTSLDLSINFRLIEFLSFVLAVFKIVNITIYLPGILFILIVTGVLPKKRMLLSRKICLMVCLLLGALLTPPDIFSQMFVASSLMLFLEILRVAICFITRYLK